MSRRPVVITGFMGAGKTTVGRALARLLGETFVDLDDAVRELEGRGPRELIDEEGEDYFRESETRPRAPRAPPGAGPGGLAPLPVAGPAGAAPGAPRGGGGRRRHRRRRLDARTQPLARRRARLPLRLARRSV